VPNEVRSILSRTREHRSLRRSTEKSSACAIAPDPLEQNILGDERYVAQTKDDVGRRENNMTQITSIKLGLIAICIATVPWSLAQTPRTGNSRSNQTGATTGAMAGHSGLSGNSTSATQLGTNFRSSASIAPNTGAHTGINAGAQIGISNQTGGITGAAAGGIGSSIGNSTETTQIGANARAGTNSTANTNAGAHSAAGAAAPASATTILPQPIRVPTPLPNNSPLGPNFSTAGQFPSPLPPASVTPTPNSSSDPGAIALTRHWRLS